MSAGIVVMETLGGFPNLPALWLRRAKPAFAYASQTAGVPPYVPSGRACPPARRACCGSQNAIDSVETTSYLRPGGKEFLGIQAPRRLCSYNDRLQARLQ